MTIELSDTSTILGHWFTNIPGGDFMATVYRDNNDSPWQLRYRFRYHVDDKAFNSQDIKNWYQGTAEPGKSEQELFDQVDGVVKMMTSFIPNPELDVIKGPLSHEEFMKIFMFKDYVNIDPKSAQ